MTDTHRSQYRIPHDLVERLQQAAAAAGRSVNAELVARLEASFAKEQALPELIEDAVRRALKPPRKRT